MRAEVPLEVQYGVGHLGVIASAAAYRDGQEWLDRAMLTIQRNHELLAVLLSQRLPSVVHEVPDATYLAWLDCRAIGDDAAQVFLDRGRVALKDGADFGAPGWVRLNLATSAATLEEIVSRMAAGASVAP
jgi:cystathionine beta-lyase